LLELRSNNNHLVEKINPALDLKLEVLIIYYDS
jgi:hypothetical protein